MRRSLILLLSFLCACSGPVRSTNVYESKAGKTAEAVVSSVETARLAVDAAARDKAYGRYLTQVLADADKDASAVAGTFGAIQPPDARADELRGTLDDLLTQATSTLADLRIAARRGDFVSVQRLAAPLPELSKKLGDFAEAHA
jgi:hypothetical protein